MKKTLTSYNRIVKKRVVIVLIILLFIGISISSSPQSDSDKVINDVKDFLYLLEPDTCPTIALSEDYCHRCFGYDQEFVNHYYNTLGQMTEKEEWIFESYFENLYSVKYREISPSFYLLWLRKKLPLSPKIEIIKIENFNDNSFSAFQSVHIKLDNLIVVLQRHKFEDARLLNFRISLAQINGRDENDLISEDIKQGKMDPVVAEVWGSRKKGYEFCGRRMPYRVIDGIPTIVKENSENTEDKAE